MIEKLINFLPLPKGLKDLLLKSKEIILYLFFGVVTTLLNGLVYLICIKCGAANVPSTVIAWIVAVLFAFFVNKLFVFASTDMTLKKVLTEMSQFVGCRLGTGVIDVAIMYVSIDLGMAFSAAHYLGLNVGEQVVKLIMKLISDFIVTLINFVASKFFIFKKKNNTSSEPNANT